MKKGSYYFGLLTDEEKENYKNNILSELRLNLLMELHYASLEDFLEHSFVWSNTPESQGHNYWQNIANSNRENIEG